LSFILDALQKSENQRRQQSGPGLATVRRGTSARPVPVWIPLLAILLVINIGVLVFLVWPNENENRKPDNPSQVQNEPIAGNPAPKPGVVKERRGEVRPLSQEALQAGENPENNMVLDTAQESRIGAGSVTIMTEQEMNALTAADNAKTKPDEQASGSVTELVANESTTQELLPALQELQIRGIISLPELHLDVHVFSTDKTGRFVFINMKKYREGDRLREGPLLESILPDGVILQYSGQRFTLQQD